LLDDDLWLRLLLHNNNVGRPHQHARRRKLCSDPETLQENCAETLSEANCDSVGPSTVVKMEPSERDVLIHNSKSMVFILHKTAVNQKMAIDINVAVTRWHHLAGKASKRQKYLFHRGDDAPWERKVQMER